jgi:hypothetical protein
MANEFPSPDPKTIWQNQPTEQFSMSADQLRYKAQRLQRKARVKTIFSIIMGIALFIFFARQTFLAGYSVPGMGLGLISLWGIYFAYQACHWTWPNSVAQDATLDTTLRSYRTGLEQQGYYARNIWLRTGLPFCFLGLALVVVPGLIKSFSNPGLFVNFVPLFGLLALWFVAFYFIRRRDRRKLAQEIKDLRAFEGANRS